MNIITIIDSIIQTLEHLKQKIIKCVKHEKND